LVRPDREVAASVGLPDTEIPVRAEHVDRIFGRRVDLAALVDEVEAFAAAEPDAIAKIEATAIAMFGAVVDELLRDRNFELAESYALRGLRWAPGLISLRVQLGRAQHGMGRAAEATVHWLAAVTAARSEQRWSPMLWLLTARALMEQDQLDAAATLLDDLADMLPEQYEFWELRGLVRDLAGNGA
jgi:predicted Zn-dependent protease